MVLKKQTVWLLTMLTLMVVLSAYYLFNNQPTEPVSLTNDDGKEVDLTQALEESDITSTIHEVGTDFFLSYRIKRDNLRAQQVSQYEKMVSSDASSQVIADAKGSLDKIYELSQAEEALESVIKAEGYPEAVVMADTDKVNVIVKSEDALSNDQVVSIIHLVQNHIDVMGNQVVVSYQQ